MNPNYTILILLVATPVLVFVIWKGAYHLACAVTHNIKMRKNEFEMRRLEAARRARDERLATQVRVMTEEVNKQRPEPVPEIVVEPVVEPVVEHVVENAGENAGENAADNTAK